MWENIEQDRYYTGVFDILGEYISGELIYNKKKRCYFIEFSKRIRGKFSIRKKLWNVKYNNW